MLFSGLAPRFGWNIIKNSLAPRIHERKNYYVTCGKQALVVSNLHATQVIEFLRKQQPDLIVNARTRVIFKSSLLKLPKLGCINIHHGLLPDQRGLMCDLWARLENQGSGFSIHQMTPDLDDGKILRTHLVTEKCGSRQEIYLDYMESLTVSAKLELQTLSQILTDISAAHSSKSLSASSLRVGDEIMGDENKASSLTVYRKNPTFLDFVRLRLRRVKI